MNVYEKIGLQRVINCSGRMTYLGVSTFSDEVAKAAVEGGQSYVVIADLLERAGQIIAGYTGGEDACPTSCASAAIALSVAGIITGGKKSLVERMPDSTGLKNEIIVQRGHVIEFGAPMKTVIRTGGGILKEVGNVNITLPEDIEEAIDENTAALFFCKSHHCVQEGIVPIETMAEIAHRHNLPLLVDAAAEEDFRKYLKKGADLVCYSGAKALEATTSGFVTGRKDLIAAVRKQYGGIGRCMKVGKEQIMGLLKALECYENKDMDAYVRNQKETNAYLIEELNKLPGLKAREVQDEAGRAIYRCVVEVDEKVTGMKALDVDMALLEGNPSVRTRNEFLNATVLTFDPRPMVKGDKELIVEKIKTILQK